MTVYISIISHNSFGFIEENIELLKINRQDDVVVIVKDNVGEDALEKYCLSNDIKYLSDSKGLGFGSNNNYIFNFIVENFDPTDDDYFLIVNPDVYISLEYYSVLLSELAAVNSNIFTIDLFKDKNFKCRDPFIRRFPCFSDFFSSFFLKRNDTVVDRSLGIAERVDWCAGSFQGYKISSYKKLKGFDEGFFMYCEDIDICRRARTLTIDIDYFEKVKAVHLAQHSNRSMFSRHFVWHLKSIFRYLFLSRYARSAELLGLSFRSRIK